MKNFLLLIFLLSSALTNAQLKTYPVRTNSQIDLFNNRFPAYLWSHEMKHKFGVLDTLSLPFFDDFTKPGIYPDSTKWLNNLVYVNRHFGRRPPTLGVATFDGLDAQGRPYKETINTQNSITADSLLSQPINLSDSSGVPYTVADSFVLSFFVQPNGYGYQLNSGDSLRLFFKNRFNNWIQVWSRAGQKTTADFELVTLKIDQPGYLHKGFQFLFTSWSRQIGNASQWNIDYVFLDKDRSVTEDHFEDYAVQTEPTPLLKHYYEMPFSHFMVDPAGESADSLYVRASNLDQVTLNIEVKHRESYLGSELINTSFAANAGNVLPRNSALRRTDNYTFYSTLNGPIPVVIDRRFEIREAGVINSYTDNDFVETQQIFRDYFAYDDGTAEQGFGFDHETNPKNIEGEIAYRFELNKRDTLYAIAAFFNQAVFDVSREQFKFRVWQAIAGPDQVTEDVLLYESETLNPEYMEEINRFSIHYLDTALILPAGTFYIGWYQSSMYNLNIGWDRNSGNVKDPDVSSEHLYYKLFGQWSNSNLPFGELMMRPYVGSKREIYASVANIAQKKEVEMYPNPASTLVHFGKAYRLIQLFDQQGQLLRLAENAQELSVLDLPNGIYFVKTCDSGHQWSTSKLLIFAQ